MFSTRFFKRPQGVAFCVLVAAVVAANAAVLADRFQRLNSLIVKMYLAFLLFAALRRALQFSSASALQRMGAARS